MGWTQLQKPQTEQKKTNSLVIKAGEGNQVNKAKYKIKQNNNNKN